MSTSQSIITVTSSTKQDPSGCNIADGEIHVVATTTNGTVQYSLTGTTRQDNGDFTGLPAGTYNIQIKDGDNTLCDTDGMSFELSEPSTPTVFITSSTDPLTCTT